MLVTDQNLMTSIVETDVGWELDVCLSVAATNTQEYTVKYSNS